MKKVPGIELIGDEAGKNGNYRPTTERLAQEEALK